MSYCDSCNLWGTCEHYNVTRFCDDCAEKYCTIRTESCDAGHDIECNNGFEELSLYEDEEDDENGYDDI